MPRPKVHESAASRSAAALSRLKASGGDRRIFTFDAETMRALKTLKEGFEGTETALISKLIRDAFAAIQNRSSDQESDEA